MDGKMKQTKVLIDYDRLMKELQDRGKTKAWLSIELNRNESYVSAMRNNPERTEQEERLMCLILGIEPGSLIRKAEEKPRKVSEEIFLMMKNLHEEMKEHEEMLEKILQKMNTNTVQIERIKESLSQKNGNQIAIAFLKDALSGGRVNVESIFSRSDSIGILRKELMHAKKELGVMSEVSGYGNNQKVFWYIPR